MTTPVTSEAAFFRLCSSCKRQLAFGVSYYVCCVSPCVSGKKALYFCSLPCFEAHVPVLRHRNAWAEEKRAPTKAAFEAERAAQEQERQSAVRDQERRQSASALNEEQPMSNEVTNEVLIVVSKVKGYIKTRAGMNTADAVSEAISDMVRKACDDAIARAKADGRKTVLARDVAGSSDAAE